MEIDDICKATGLSKGQVIKVLASLTNTIPSPTVYYRGGWRKSSGWLFGGSVASNLVLAVLP